MRDAPPNFADARDHVAGQVVRFARTLRANGADVPANAALAAAEALAAVGLDDRDRVRAATHATLVADPRDSEVFDDHFPAFWYRLRTALEAAATADDVGDRTDDGTRRGLYGDDASAGSDDAATTDATGTGTGDAADAETRSRRVAESDADPATPADAGDRTRSGTYSGAGAGEQVDDGVAAPERPSPAVIDRFERALATLAGRRWTRAPTGRRVDARRAIRRSLSTGGVAVSLPRRARAPRALRACVLVDVSRSVLDAVDRGFLLATLDGLVADARSVRVFFFDTDLREVTGAFERSDGDPGDALARAEVDWGGGTRIGDALATLRRRFPDAVDRRAVTLVVSDGLDVGEVDRLERGMAWLSRRSGPVLWLNPLAVSGAYEPTCRGMATALPYVDGLFAFGGPDDLSEVARQVERHGPGGPIGYEYDFRERERDRDGPREVTA